MAPESGTKKMKIIIVGGVAGGASCAARLRRLDENAEILMVERGPYVSYANCGLPYHVGGTIEQESSLLVATEQTFREQFAIDCRTRCEVVGISPQQKTVELKNHLTEEHRIRQARPVTRACAIRHAGIDSSHSGKPAGAPNAD
jgi:NADPH-dependent 2,4-dienoyl-CoA reductase/sulfur reductase-like enzyme